MTELSTEQALGIVESAAAGRDYAIGELKDADEALVEAILDAYRIPGISYARIGAAAGLSKQRIAQIVKGAK